MHKWLISLSESILISSTKLLILSLSLAILGLTSPIWAKENPPPKKIVILYATIGGGHKAAAEAIQSQIQDSGVEVEIVLIDVLAKEYLPLFIAEGTFDKWYQRIIRTSATGYHAMFHVNHFLRSARFFGALSLFDQLILRLRLAYSNNPAALTKLLKKLNELKPDLIFSTFNHTTEDIAAWRKLGLLPPETKLASTLTDYVFLPDYYSMLAENTDAIFFPSADLLEKYKVAGVPLENAHVSGIPVDPAFSEKMTEEQRLEILEGLGLKPNLPTVFIISGRAGHANFEKIVKGFYKDFPQEVQLVVATGNNRDARQALEKIASQNNGNSHVHLIVKATISNTEVNQYMKASELVVTKAGGLSATQITAVGVPVILLDNNGGQEVHNIRFFEELGAAKRLRDQSRVAQLTHRILNTDAAAKMIASQYQISASMENPGLVPWVKNALSLTGDPCAGGFAKK